MYWYRVQQRFVSVDRQDCRVVTADTCTMYHVIWSNYVRGGECAWIHMNCVCVCVCVCGTWLLTITHLHILAKWTSVDFNTRLCTINLILFFNRPFIHPSTHPSMVLQPLPGLGLPHKTPPFISIRSSSPPPSYPQQL